MRLACYNVENLFDRAKAMNLETWRDGKAILETFAELNRLLGELAYDAASKTRKADLMLELGLAKSDTGPFVILRRNRGGLLRRPRTGGLVIEAAGRADWVGSLELRDEPIDEHAMRNTARVLKELDADVIGVVEAENRPVLAAFNDEILKAVGGTPFRHVMVIDGNDERGIDVGLLTRERFPIGLMRSHVDDRLPGGERVFSRDCPDFSVTTAAGATLHVLVNHLKSKGYGSAASSNARRLAQAGRVKAIYEELTAQGAGHVAIVGDLNDTPDSDPLAPLLKETDLRDVFEVPGFDTGGYPGTYGSCGPNAKIDYILLSPKLFAKATGGGVFRKGMWPGVSPKRWDVFEELTDLKHAASDHAALWVDLDL